MVIVKVDVKIKHVQNVSFAAVRDLSSHRKMQLDGNRVIGMKRTCPPMLIEDVSKMWELTNCADDHR